VIRFERVTVTYPDAARPVLRDVDLYVAAGELCVLVGLTGAGKSTVLGAINGLVPHFTGGRLAGRVTVAGHDTRDHPPRELAGLVGVVAQDPLRGFVTDTVEAELAYGMEQLGIAPATMRKRVEETLDLLGIAELRERSIRTLSGGQQQRVAIGAVLTAHPQVLVLDEPTSALDPAAAEDVLAALTRLVHDLGMTVVVAEHRLERVIEYADRLVTIGHDGYVQSGLPADLIRAADVAPPVVRLGQLAGWNPLPLSVRDARRLAPNLHARLVDAPAPRRGRPPGAPAVSASGVVVRYGKVAAVRGVDLVLRAGEVVAIMGRNGSGKSTLLWALHGSGRRDGGRVVLADGADPSRLDPRDRTRRVALLPQSPTDLLFLASVGEECALADRAASASAGTCRRLLDELTPDIADGTHPRDLSEGQRLGLALAVQLTPAPAVLLLDEPTRGLDETAKRRLTAVLAELAAGGRVIAVATHDVEFVAGLADRVIVMALGEVVADGPTADVVLASPVYAPQVAKVLQPDPWLTVAEVATAIGPPA